jgi:hypothetical protein
MHQSRYPRTARATLLASLLVCVAGFSGAASGYQEAGHYYTVGVVTHFATPALTGAEANLVAFCAQLPDQSEDLDAVKVYSNLIFQNPVAWVRWAVSNSDASALTRRMITVQHLLHGLTGGEAQAVQAVAANVLTELGLRLPRGGDPRRPAGLCALGLGFHLYGDAFAHQMMGEECGQNGQQPCHMYPTGRGHAADLHYPDLPLCSDFAPPPRWLSHCVVSREKRFERWADYWGKAAVYLGPNGAGGALERTLHDAIVNEIFALGPDATDRNEWAEADMESRLARRVPNSESIGEFLASHKSTSPCDDVLQAALNDPLKETGRFHCRDAWNVFSEVAKAEFRKIPASRAGLGLDLDGSVYKEDPLLK